jgi:hypothetical protein
MLSEEKQRAAYARRYFRVGLDRAGVSSEVWRERMDVSEPVRGRVTVLGEGGAFLELEDNFTVGSSVGLRLELPGTDKERIVCHGIVKEHIEGEGIGVEFTELGPDDRTRLKSAVLHWAMLP